MMKRKTEEMHQSNGRSEVKKRALSDDAVISRFREGLFDPAELKKYTQSYAASGPYKHGVISPLIAPELLRAVRNEIEQNLSFTEKETDIYKIFQSGDLANLDGLDDASLSRLPSLLQLRDALYSAKFRAYLSALTGSGELSGKKTDMAINVYTEGCHLLCHDDVIGSRRLSYILYLTDPDTPWKAEWGGALRLYPTTTVPDLNGEDVKIPSPDFTLSIPPAFNQLSFFTVQPGESFHDVEEVYHPPDNANGKEKRVRMAISGWFHIPQEGEDGYEPGLEERLAERSSLSQLQGRGDSYDQPQPQVIVWDEEPAASNGGDKGKGKSKEIVSSDEGPELNEYDLDFLLKFLAPSYLTPDIAEELSEAFLSDSSLSLEKLLSEKFATRLREYIETQEKKSLPRATDDIESTTDWKVARPPHKQRYLFQQPQSMVEKDSDSNPVKELLTEFLPSQPFRKWLTLVTGADRLTDYNMMVRRFRRGQDYTLANSYEGEEPRLEFTFGLTPSGGWEKAGNEDEDDDDDDEEEEEGNAVKNGQSSKLPTEEKQETHGKEQDGPSVGGYEIYMAGDDEEGDAGDAAIYKAANGDDDGILFSMAAGWNRMSIVLRDSGTLKFVKYVSAAAQGDRWDISGEIGIVFADDDE